MIKWLSNLFSKKEKKFDPMELDCFKCSDYFIENERLKFKLRVSEGCINHLNKRLDHAHKIMSHEKVGIYKHIETPEQRFQKNRDLATFTIQHRGFLSAIRIYKYAGLPVSEELEKEFNDFKKFWDKKFDWSPRNPYTNRRNYNYEQNRNSTDI